MVQNGYIIQDTHTQIYRPKTFNYMGLCAYESFPLIHISNPECRSITKQQSTEKDTDGFIHQKHFISNRSLLTKYLYQCKSHDITTRILFVESEYSEEIYIGNIGESVILGYECCPLPIDEQVISDIDWCYTIESVKSQLNKYGLFDSYSDASEFLKLYDSYVARGIVGDDVENIYIMKVMEITDINNN